MKYVFVRFVIFFLYNNEPRHKLNVFIKKNTTKCILFYIQENFPY